MNTPSETLPIRQVVEETGVSKELIHHYLRQGLIPACQARGRYDEQQVELLRLIRRLREEHQLPLEVIRQLVSRFDQDPRAMELLLLGEPLARRLERLATRGELGGGASLGPGALCAEARISPEQLEEYVTLGLVQPDRSGSEHAFSGHDARIAELCQRGQALGVRLESLRTIASFVRLGFELEGDEFFGGRSLLTDGADDFFLRREYLVSFVQNLVQARVQVHLSRLTRRAAPAVASPDEVVYRPSRAFRRRHGLDRMLDQHLERLGRERDDLDLWRRTARLQLHAGRYREAVFFLEQAMERWPDDADLRGARGVALLLSGAPDMAAAELERLDRSSLPPLALAALALCRHLEPHLEDPAGRILEPLERALKDAGQDADGALVRLLAGWIFAALPGALGLKERGEELLLSLHRELSLGDPRADLPGMAGRLRLNAAYLLLEAGQRATPDSPASDPDLHLDLRDEVCAMDPGSLMASRAYEMDLDEPPPRS